MRYLACIIFLIVPAFAQLPCDGTFYLSKLNILSNSTQIVAIAPDYSESVFVTAPAGMQFNGLAYDNIDGTLISVLTQPFGSNPAGTIIQISRLGTISLLGPVSGLPNPIVGGTTDDSGNYWAATSTNLYKVDKFSLTATPVLTGIGMSNIGDIVFDPTNSRILTITTNGKLYSVDTQTGGTTVISLQRSFDAVFLNGGGQLFGFDNGLFKIDSGSGSVTQLSTASPAINSDGANCPYFAPIIRPIINLSETVNYQTFPIPGIDLLYTTRFSNNGTEPAYNLCVTQMVAQNTDFKLSSIRIFAPPGVNFTIIYSSNFNRRNPNLHAAAAAANWTYIPTNGGGGAAPGYDRRVTAFQIKTTTPFSHLYPLNEGYLTYTAQIP